MHRPKRWNMAPPSEAAGQLADRLKTSPLIAQMLINRGMVEADDCRKFLTPSLKDLYDPSQLPDLSRAAERLAKAIRDQQRIVIYGDYDVDGITATAILWHAIRLLGGQVDYYIPHRLEEGYGLNAEAMEQLCERADLIVTVDCGITAIEEAKVAANRGVDLIITDHHEWKEITNDERGMARPEYVEGMNDESKASSIHHSSFIIHHSPLLPECHAIVHPRLGGTYGNPNLCGAGVAFKLAWGLGQAYSGALRVNEDYRRFLVEATGLAALGTIADVVPLVGENRTLARFGLGGLKQSRLIGIKALIESAGLTGQKLDSYHVGFLLAPRLNASGRMGHAREAVEMLTRADVAEAMRIASYLEQQNRQRQTIEKQIFEEALRQVEELGLDRDDCRGLVLGAKGWHPGVIGIVASRIVGKFNRPTVMIALNEDMGQGSARSIPGFHLARALNACREHLETCGGHEMAAGLRIEPSKFDAFREAFRDYANRSLTCDMLMPEIHLDCVAELRQVSEALVSDMDRLGPFGTANRRPLLCCKEVELATPPRRVGRGGEHLQLLVRQNGVSMKCIAFNWGAWFDRLVAGRKLDLAVEPCLNDFNGRRSVELTVKDIRIL